MTLITVVLNKEGSPKMSDVSEVAKKPQSWVLEGKREVKV